MRLLAPSRGTHTYWTDKDPVIFEGVIGLTKDRLFPGSLEYFIGDGAHKYSELPKYGGAEASILSKAYTLVLRDADGKIDSASLPEATPTNAGAVKASTTKAGDNVVKADANGSLDGWKDAISDAVANPNAGLIKNADGTLGVDFEQMPTAKFEALLKSLKMQIPLSATLNLYVDKNHADAADIIEDGRGTQNKPFKTIQAAVNFATQTYAFGAYSGNIYVAPGTYEESVSLPQYTRTSGSISLRALDETTQPTIATPSASNYATPITISGGSWSLRRLNLSAIWSDPQTDNLIHTSAVLSVTGGNTFCDIKGCSLSGEFTGPAALGWANPRMISARDGAIVDISVMQGYQNSFTFSKGNANASWILIAETSGQIRFRSANIENNTDSQVDMYEIPCSGSVHTFANADRNASVSIFAGGKYFPYFTGNMTGKKYSAVNYSLISAPYGGFPGDTDGTPGASDSYKDMDTFARYSERTTPNS